MIGNDNLKASNIYDRSSLLLSENLKCYTKKRKKY